MHLLVENPATVTAWSVAHALAADHAVLISAGPVTAHQADALRAETRPATPEPTR